MEHGKGPVAAVVAVCTSLTLAPADDALAACTGGEQDASQLTVEQAERAIRCEVAGQRARRGLSTWRLNGSLALAAARHARDMVRRGYFSHTSPAGGRPATRVRRTGYLLRCRPCTIGENLAWGTDRSSAPASLVRAWMKSPGHRRIVLSGRFRDVGVGIVRGAPRRPERRAFTVALVVGG